MGIQYTAAASRFEVLEVFREAARAGAPVHVHMRHNGTKEPQSSTNALEEVLAAALVTGAPLHVVHLHSTSVGFTARHLAMIDGARARGLDVTTECYPYTAGMTDIASGVFDEGWREALGIDYPDLLWAATGERLTAETFARRRKQGGMVAVFSIPEEMVRAAIAHPLVIVASDAVMEKGKGHPRSAATNARLLGVYVAGREGAAADGGAPQDHPDARAEAGAPRARDAGQGPDPRGRRRRPHAVRSRAGPRPRDLDRARDAAGGDRLRHRGRRARGRAGRVARGRQAGASGAGADPLAARHARYTGNPAAASSSPHSGA